MRSAFGLVLVLGLGLAGFAVYMVKGYIDEQEMLRAMERAQVAEQIPTVEIVAINKPLPYGSTITPEDVQLIQYAEPYLPEGVFRTIEEVFPRGAEAPRVLTRAMENLEPILAAKVTAPGENAGILSLLSPNMSAYAIRVDVASGVSGLLRPGNIVDVYWSGRMDDQTGIGSTKEVTQLIQPNMRIIAIDQNTDTSFDTGTIARTVTVEGTRNQVAALTLAQTTGNLFLALVGTSADAIAMDDSDGPIVIDQNALLGIEEVAPVVEEIAPVVEEEKVCTTRVRRGADVIEMEIPCTN